MEFFERAHVVKKNPPKKDSKSEETVKKQLKQMLHGYKRSDNKLIKEAGSGSDKYEDLVADCDDSSSVSGFSDLNLTNSSTECDKSHQLRKDNSAHLYKIEETNSNSTSNEEFSLEDESFKVDLASIPEDDEDMKSEDTHLNTSNSDSEINPFWELNQATSSELTSSDSEFDRDGNLASEIFKKMGKIEGNNSISKGRKRKVDKILKESNVLDKQDRYTNYSIIDKKDSDIARLNISQESDDSLSFSQDSSMNSSPFVSLTAEHMPDQSLSEILGEYKYSTVKNLPCDKQNIINSSLFSAKSVDSAEILVDDDIDSLIPELGEEPTIEDLEVDAEVDLSLQQTNEDMSTIVCDDKIQSEELLTDIQNSAQSVEINHVNPVKVYYGVNKCIFILKHPSKIYIHGKVRIKVLGGTAEAFGYTFKNDYCDLYAPNYNCNQCIKTVESQNMYYGLFGKLTSSGISVKDAEEIVTELGEHDTVISMSALSCPKMDFVENNFKNVDLFSRHNKKVDNCFKQASEILGCNLYLMPTFRCYEVNYSWEHVLNCREGNERRTIVCGGKGLGKSTFLRYYVNKLLANGPVLVIDLDPGQAEFTVAGHVSATVATKPLLGPSFTHLTSPDLMLNIGMISVMDNPTRYINAVAEVLAHCRSCTKYKSMPWIINTMGMTNNMGLKVITLIIMHVQPTFVLQIDNKKRGYGTELHPETARKLLNDFKNDRLFKNVMDTDLSYKFFAYSREDNDMKSMSLAPRDERYLNFLAYFGELLNVYNGPGLLGIIPYEVRLNDLNIGTNVKIPKDAVTKVINGKIIALCQLSTLDKGKVFVLGDNAIRCLGHGLVRSVDFEKGILYVVTPTPIATLSLVNMLLYADWVPELIGEERRLPDSTAVPYRAASVNYKQKQLMFAPRRRFNPLQLLKSKGIPKLKPSVVS